MLVDLYVDLEVHLARLKITEFTGQREFRNDESHSLQCCGIAFRLLLAVLDFGDEPTLREMEASTFMRHMRDSIPLGF